QQRPDRLLAVRDRGRELHYPQSSVIDRTTIPQFDESPVGECSRYTRILPEIPVDGKIEIYPMIEMEFYRGRKIQCGEPSEVRTRSQPERRGLVGDPLIQVGQPRRAEAGDAFRDVSRHVQIPTKGVVDAFRLLEAQVRLHPTIDDRTSNDLEM